MPRQLAQLTEETRALRAITETLAETAAEHTHQLAEQSHQLTELRRISENHTLQLAELRRISESHTLQLAELRRISENHTVQMTELTTQVKEHTVQLVELTAQVKEHTIQLTELRRISDNHTVRMDRISNDTSTLRHMYSEAQIKERLVAVALSADLYDPILIPDQERVQIARQLGLDRDTRLSFVQADAMFQARDEENNPVYGAIEVSWTADFRDTGRARRNAALLRKATGSSAIAIVAGNRWVNELDWEGIHWYQIEE